MALRIGRCRIPEYLKRFDMTQAQYAKHIGVSEGFVSKIISGDKKLSLLKAKITANLFNCCIDDLYSWEEIDTKGKR